jgi:hypothetical protein
MALDVERRIDELYASSPETFTAERNALAAELRTEGNKEEEQRVRTLRRPSVAAWAANAIARAEPQLVEALIEAGGSLRSAQQRALSGRSAEGLREATERRREIVSKLRDTAGRQLRSAGKDPSNLLDELAGTFEAASVDDTAAELLRTGRLERTLTPPSGLGEATGLTVLEGGGAGRRRTKAEEPEPKPDRTGERERARRAKELEKANERAKAATARADALRREAEDVRRSLEQTTRALRRADAEVREAAREVRRAESALRAAERG